MRLLSCFVLFTGLTFSLFGDTGDKWTVIGMVGKWNFTDPSLGGGKLAVGMSLTPGLGVLKRDAQGNELKSGSVTLERNSGHLTFACDDPKTLPGRNVDCAASIPAPRDAPAPDEETDAPLSALFASIVNIFHSEPDKYYQAVSRGGGDLEDAVVKRQGQSVDLTPVVSGLSEGSYRLTFAPSHAGTGHSGSEQSSAISWNPDKPGPVTGPNLAPGLYTVNAASQAGESQGEAWMLVVDDDKFENKAAQFAKVKDITAKWKNDSPAASVTAIRRAALDSLAR